MCVSAANAMALRTSSFDATATIAAGVESTKRALNTALAAAYSLLDGSTTPPSSASFRAAQSLGPATVGGVGTGTVAGGGGGAADRHEPTSSPAAAAPIAPRRNA